MKFMNHFFQKSLRLMLASVLVIGLNSLGTAVQAADTGNNYPPTEEIRDALDKTEGTVFPIGNPNRRLENNFTGRTFLASLAKDKISVSNVTFTKGAHTYWHIHHGSCQILIPESGSGYYQIWGEEAHKIVPGVVVTIPEGVKHWHGAGPETMMQHLSVMLSNPDVSTEWLEPVDEAAFASLK